MRKLLQLKCEGGKEKARNEANKKLKIFSRFKMLIELNSYIKTKDDTLYMTHIWPSSSISRPMYIHRHRCLNNNTVETKSCTNRCQSQSLNVSKICELTEISYLVYIKGCYHSSALGLSECAKWCA